MARKASGESESSHGFNDIIGVVLLVAALLLLVAQLSFNRNDISFLTTQVNKPAYNWIGTLGAWIAFGFFSLFGSAAYLLPPLLAIFGAAYLLDFFGYLRERLRWSVIWSMALLISFTGLLYLVDSGGVRGAFHEKIGAQSVGGWLGFMTYGESKYYQWGLSLLNPIGATIVYAALGLVSVISLTNFRLGLWLRGFRGFWDAQAEASDRDRLPPEEAALERKARELQKQAKQLQEEVARSGLGADGQPVPEPTVRDLSVPQSKPRAKKPA